MSSCEAVCPRGLLSPRWSGKLLWDFLASRRQKHQEKYSKISSLVLVKKILGKFPVVSGILSTCCFCSCIPKWIVLLAFPCFDRQYFPQDFLASNPLHDEQLVSNDLVTYLFQTSLLKIVSIWCQRDSNIPTGHHHAKQERSHLWNKSRMKP